MSLVRRFRLLWDCPACTRCGTAMLLAVHAGLWECLRCGLLKAAEGSE